MNAIEVFEKIARADGYALREIYKYEVSIILYDETHLLCYQNTKREWKCVNIHGIVMPEMKISVLQNAWKNINTLSSTAEKSKYLEYMGRDWKLIS